MGSPGSRIELADGAWMEVLAGWLDPEEARRARAALLEEVPWIRGVVRIFGKEVPEPRLSAWMGDPGSVYTYSGVRHEPSPWTPTVAALRARVSAAVDEPFNSVLCNLYRDGGDAMGAACRRWRNPPIGNRSSGPSPSSRPSPSGRRDASPSGIASGGERGSTCASRTGCSS